MLSSPQKDGIYFCFRFGDIPSDRGTRLDADNTGQIVLAGPNSVIGRSVVVMNGNSIQTMEDPQYYTKQLHVLPVASSDHSLSNITQMFINCVLGTSYL